MSFASLAGGVLLAAAAGACFDGAVALQAVEARALPTGAVGTGLVGGLLRRPRWLAATALAIAGWPLQVAALELAPLTVVQPTLALGLVVLLVLGARMLGEPVRPRDLVAVAVLVAGLGLLAWAAPERSAVEASAVALAAVVGGLLLAAVVPWLARRRAGGLALVIAAGCGYAASGITTKLLSDALADGAIARVVAWAALTALAAAAGLGDEMGALQRVVASRVAAGAFALQTAVPVLCAPLLTQETWGATPLGGGAILAGLALVVAGAATLGSTAAVSRLVSGRA